MQGAEYSKHNIELYTKLKKTANHFMEALYAEAIHRLKNGEMPAEIENFVSRVKREYEKIEEVREYNEAHNRRITL